VLHRGKLATPGWLYHIIISDVFSGHLLKILSFLFYKYYIMTRREIHVLAARLDESGGLVANYRGGGYMSVEQWRKMGPRRRVDSIFS